MAKKLKSAAEIAEFIRQKLNEPELRVAVYSGPHGWNAKAYAAPHVVVEIQTKVNKVSGNFKCCTNCSRDAYFFRRGLSPLSP